MRFLWLAMFVGFSARAAADCTLWEGGGLQGETLADAAIRNDLSCSGEGRDTILTAAVASGEMERVKLVLESLPGWLRQDRILFHEYLARRGLEGKSALELSFAASPGREIYSYLEPLVASAEKEAGLAAARLNRAPALAPN